MPHCGALCSLTLSVLHQKYIHLKKHLTSAIAKFYFGRPFALSGISDNGCRKIGRSKKS